MIRTPVKPEVIRWARKRFGVSQEDLSEKFKKLPEWECGSTQPTLRQLETFARTVQIPVGYMFLSKPLKEEIPIEDYRLFPDQVFPTHSPNMLDTIYTCQSRQDWYRVNIQKEMPISNFVGSVTIKSSPEIVANQIRDTIGFDFKTQQKCKDWTEVIHQFCCWAEKAGILVMLSGIVKCNTHRRLDPDEFKGFALSDPIAPLVFVNSRNLKATWAYLLAHEIAHIWLGTSALSNLGILPEKEFNKTEIWCTQVALELLLPKETLISELNPSMDLSNSLLLLSKEFKVSTLVILRRLLDLELLTQDQFKSEWVPEYIRLGKNDPTISTGRGDFYQRTIKGLGNKFAHALIKSTLEGKTLYRDAIELIGIHNADSFKKLAHRLGVI